VGYTVEAGWDQSNSRISLVSSVKIFVTFELSVLVQRAIIFDMISINLFAVRSCIVEFAESRVCVPVVTVLIA
jgi:hypothetical protein